MTSAILRCVASIVAAILAMWALVILAVLGDMWAADDVDLIALLDVVLIWK